MIERDDEHLKRAFEALRREDAPAARRSRRPLPRRAPGRACRVARLGLAAVVASRS